MVFQDFDLLSERRKAERKRKMQKTIIISVIVGVLFVFLIAAGVFAVATKSGVVKTTSSSSSGSDKGSAESGESKPTQSTTTKQVSHAQGLIKIMCNTTDYKDKCEKSLVKQANETVQPKDLLKAGISAVAREIRAVLDHTSTLKFDTEAEKSAFEDCKTLIADATEELEESISQFVDRDLEKISKKVPDLNNWLSAVMSYQQTCIDGFPEGKLKTQMEKAFVDAKQLTSNSLAMISGVASVFSAFKVPSVSSRRLLESASGPTLDNDGFPTWMHHEDRRMLKKSDADKPTPNVTVAKDGSGDFNTISDALNAIPQKYTGRYVIYVKLGVYDETVTITKNMVNITMYGDGSQKSIITGNKNFVDGVRTFQTASFVVLGEGFLGKAMGFRNTAGPEKRQAVAARVQADRAIFLNCRFEGYQDTLYTQAHRQFYRSCVVTGTVDFIFGDASVIFQNCMLKIRKPMANQQNAVTAQGRIDKRETTGIVIQNCNIMADESLAPVKSQFKNYLGRPWKEYSRTIIMESTIEDLIHTEGWLAWEGDFALTTLYYAEYNNKGGGAKVDGRVKWAGYKKGFTKQDAMKFTAETFLQGEWIKALNVPVRLGLSS